MRPIDADAVKASIKQQKAFMSRFGGSTKKIFNMIAKAMIKELDNSPTIELARKKGKWIVDEDGMIHCSNCYTIPTSRIIIDAAKLVYDMAPIRERMLFCPNCGAEMEKGEE